MTGSQPREIDPANLREGARVRHWREVLKLSVRALAEKLGLSKSALSRIENGLQALEPSTRERLIELLGITIAQFYEPAVQVAESAKGGEVAA